MFYNKWIMIFDFDQETFRLYLDTSDKTDREERKEYVPYGVPGQITLYFPRIDKETNLFYRKKIIEYGISLFEKEIKIYSDRIKNCNVLIDKLKDL